MTSKIEKICGERNVKLTKSRKIIAQVLSESNDHPSVEEIWSRVSKISPNIGIATIYRTLKIFEENNIIAKHNFGEGRIRYEEINEDDHHDHLVDVQSGNIIEFYNEEIELLKKKIARDFGYELVDHRLELYVVPLEKSGSDSDPHL
ncbi:MAG: Fur family ferric uptake transcriptional regulator [Rickettsiales bacterium]|jgi:Fur family ferric uptake transcriptional regulator